MSINWKKLHTNIPPFIRVNKKQMYETLYIEDFKDGNTRGESRFDTKQLVLQSNRPSKETVHTYFHELLHIYSDEFGANLTENQVLALENALPYVIEFVNTLNGVKRTSKSKKTKK